jgi:nucleotide-binding universal stress UspA family protein
MDFSEPSLAAVRVAAQIARRGEGRITLLHVLPRVPKREPSHIAEEADVRALLTALAETLEPVPVDVRLVRGVPAIEILALRELQGVDLVALGAGGHRLREFFLGSVADRVLRRPGCPLLLVRSSPPSGDLKRIAVGQERCKSATPWLETALALAHIGRGELTAIHVLPQQGYLSNGHEVDLHPERAHAALTDLIGGLDRTVPYSVRATRGDAADILSAQMRAKEFDLLVVGAERNRDGWPGRVTDRLARTPGASLLVVWPAADADEGFDGV